MNSPLPSLRPTRARGSRPLRSLLAVPALACAGLLLPGCLKPDAADLGSGALAPRTVPACGSCHAYPLHDVNHAYHLHGMNPREGIQAKYIYERKTGAILCMDCHFGSIAHKPYTWYDTLWGTEGNVHGSADKQPGDPIYRIDSIPGFLPLPVDAMGKPPTPRLIDSLLQSASDLGQVVSWLTGRSHMDGVVDVEFSPNAVLDPSVVRTAFRARDLSCSSIQCHNAPKKTYRWASPSAGMPGCPSLAHTSAADSSCGYEPGQEPN